MKKRLLLLMLSGIFLFGQNHLSAQKTVTLDECIRLSLKNNLQMVNGEIDIKSVNSRIKEAKSGLLPSVDITGQYQYYLSMPKMLVPAEFFGGKAGEYAEVAFGSEQTSSASLQVTQVLYNQKVFIGLKAAKTAKNMTELQVSKTKEDLIYNVSAVYYNLQVVQENLNMIDTNIVRLEKLLNTSKILQANEIISRTNLKRLQINYDNLKNERNNLQLVGAKAYNLLKYLLGVQLSEPIVVAAFEPVEASEAMSKGNVENRTDVKLVREQISLAELDKKAAIADYYPTLAGVFNYGVTGNYNKVSPFKSINDNWIKSSYIALQLKIPVFSGLSRYNQVKQKNFAVQKAQNNYELLRQSAEKEMSDAVNNLMSSNNSFDNAKRSLELAQDVFKSSDTEYRNGLISLSDILQIQNELTTARNNYSTALINLRLAEIELKKANGSLSKSY